ncbi:MULTISPECIES: DUF2567 domain-containing protein [unclassified Crossiella]|uniref:DUF2567 domain-containing protein n=1 Tax=unclassified Crossiella TaxID=2620835 RepID=UPI001FFFD79D|nr:MULTISPECIES: DUF2567 domain-containing protein [unclassified Crossiella]MCK2240305.1 DUF2567 domain-containing protein [Crossiella sp. S99.2]MCK2253243.1 DUF2567 domain-containing protein [Crossiella sp. S99.1]
MNEPPLPGRADPLRIQPGGAVGQLPEEAYLPFPMPRPIPRVVVKPDLLPAISMASLISLIGIPVALLWSLLAPPIQRQVATNGRTPALPGDSNHQFDSLAVFVLLTLAAGVITGAVVWLLRRRRGPVVMIAATAGSALAAYLATLMGGLFTGFWYDLPTSVQLGDVYTVAPGAVHLTAILAQPLAFIVVYGACAAWNGMDDLGRRLG